MSPLAFLALAGSVAIAAPAMARSPDGTIRIDYTDLDLASDAGVAELQARVERAAAKVCGEADNRDLTAMREAARCRAVALESAQPQVQFALAQARAQRSYAANTRAAR